MLAAVNEGTQMRSGRVREEDKGQRWQMSKEVVSMSLREDASAEAAVRCLQAGR
jgi:hypothetical protein